MTIKSISIPERIVLVDIKSDGVIPDYQDVGWFQGIEDGFVVINGRDGNVSRYKVAIVKRLVFLESIKE